ncbi:HlyD family secretion protein [Sphingomonas sp. HF-S4]|uniref:HlyD family secretion protein n=1 Tax=Sphingomonas agrestis TaxID=3080540 RepID=A0ABU3Y6N7_9SPHN|nr:HlyD family secretion protein [Sphingomonas sp. HF-S4]MDV3456971.1 HlyD family secretion protein [Sphingomonas sp. HF-S4]
MAEADPKIEKAPDTVAVEPAPETEVEAVEPKAKRGLLRPLLMFGVPLLLIGVVGFFWLTSGRYASTDNAYVQQDKVSVSAEVAGRIVNVAVRENQRVKKGDLLFEIDPAPYRIAVAQADAAIANAQVELQTLKTSYAGTGADIQAARDSIVAAQEDYQRQAELMKSGFTTRARLQQSEHGLEQARATLQRANADAAEARSKLATGAAVPGENPQIAAARVQRDQAQLNLSRTKVYAPADGVVSQSQRLQVGQQMMTGLPALTIVTSDQSWIEANFKETDLNKMRVGQCAEMSFDAYPGLKLKGHVASIGAGTGSEFSVLPAQNANGNWVKVTQRVPVRLFIDEKSSRALIAGLSSDVEVDLQGPCK